MNRLYNIIQPIDPLDQVMPKWGQKHMVLQWINSYHFETKTFHLKDLINFLCKIKRLIIFFLLTTSYCQVIWSKSYKSFTYVKNGKASLQMIYLQGGPKKSLWCALEEKCLWNSRIFFDAVFFSIYLHLLKKLELSKLNRKKVMRL